MKRSAIIFASILFLAAGMLCSAQDMPPQRKQATTEAKPPKKFWDRVSLGGYLGAQFGSVTYIDVSPLAIYEVTSKFYTGLGFTYLYWKDKRYSPPYSSSGYGGSVLARYHVWKDLFVQAEYDPLNLVYYDYYDDGSGNIVRGPKTSMWIHDLLIGAGYRAWLGGRAFATLAVFYNVNETYYSPNQNPVIRIGFGVGL